MKTEVVTLIRTNWHLGYPGGENHLTIDLGSIDLNDLTEEESFQLIKSKLEEHNLTDINESHIVCNEQMYLTATQHNGMFNREIDLYVKAEMVLKAGSRYFELEPIKEIIE